MRGTTTCNPSEDERGVSEVVGFVIVLGIVTTSIGLVYLNGVPALDDQRDSAKSENSLRSFALMKDSLDSVSRTDGVSSRDTQVRLNGGALSVNSGAGSQTWVNVSIINGSDYNICDPEICNTTVGYVAYSTDSGTVVYENGALIREASASDASVMIEEPDWRISTDRTVVPAIDVNGSGSVGGEGIFVVSAENAETDWRLGDSIRGTDSDYNVSSVRITVRTPDNDRLDAWKTYLEDFDSIDDVDYGSTSDTAWVEVDPSTPTPPPDYVDTAIHTRTKLNISVSR
ncbi:MAG: hypothetical protein SV253_02185 [Halobacteria archaeon]|nr:hypothetical protein [Halobacteria archaeon]